MATLEMIDEEKLWRVHSAARLARSASEHAGTELAVEAAGVRGRHVERVPLT